MHPAPITPEIVRRLSAGRWLIPVLGTMADGKVTRFGVLARELPLSKSVLSATLDRLVKDGWIVRNPGHGHPLRPEYFLTHTGQWAAAWSHRVMDQRRRLGLEVGVIGRWSLPLVERLSARSERFSDLQRGLPPITARALALELTALRTADLIDLRLQQPMYRLTGRGRRLATAIGAISS